jgi:hypothetical protein
VWISRRVSRRRSNWLRRASDRALDLVELCLALDREQGDFPAAACLALEGPRIDRRPVDFGRLQQAEGDQPAAAAGADRQQGQAAAAAGDGARCISRELDHGNSLGRRRRHDLHRSCKALRTGKQGCWHRLQTTPARGQPSTFCAATQAWHTSNMTDPYSGFAFKFSTRDINSPGGVKTRQLLVVAKSLPEASKIAHAMILGALFENSGPEILARARKLGIKDHDAGIDDGTAS